MTSRLKLLLGALLLAALLMATLNNQGLWTDEAFSAFIASHRTLASCWHTLVTGDSSDLQMVLYYLYLHLWTIPFGQSEIAFRTANFPFILLYAGALVWASRRLFHSNWVWIIAALAPLAVIFSTDTRPYFDVIALSLTCLTCLLAYVQSPTPAERKWLPWAFLLLLMLGAGFHMLMLLLGPPLVILLAVYYRSDKTLLRWADWKRPLFILFIPGLAMAAYFTWTFRRGATYDYSNPDLLSMASVLFRFAGLSGYAPNRHYDLPFTPYLIAMALATAAFVLALSALFLAKSKFGNGVTFYALFAALVVAVIQVCVLSFVVHQQIEFRHLSSLLPLLLLLIMSGLSAAQGREQGSLLILFAALAIGLTWLGSDIRMLVLPEYQREDFRGAIHQALELHTSDNAAIALAADPVAAAYYGLDLEGPAPCFPLTDSCAEGFAKVPWPKKAPAQFALFWTAPQIQVWLATQHRDHRPAVLVISRSRHPMIKNCAWWPLLATQPNYRIYPFFGFHVYLLP